jgi:O-antigen ligase
MTYRSSEMRTFVGASRLAPPVVTVVAIVASYELTIRRLSGDALIVPLILVMVAGIAVLLRPRPAFFLLLGLTYVLPRTALISFAGVRSDPGELLAYGLVVAWLVHVVTVRATPRTRYVGAMAGFLVAVAVGVFVGSSHQVSSDLLKGQTKAYLLYLLVLPATAFFASRTHKRQLEGWVIWVATAGAAYVLVELALGHDVAPGGSFNTLGISASAQRLKPAVLELMIVATMLVLARLLTDAATPVRIAQLAVFVTLFAFSFYRSIWIGLMLGAALLVAIAPGGALGPSAHEVPRRLASVISPRITQDSSYTDRSTETEQAVKTLRRSPVVGVGIAAPYGAQITTYSDQLKQYVYVDRPWSHNSYLQLYLQLGLLGLAAMTALAGTAVSGMRGQLRAGTYEDGLRAAAAGAALLVLAFKALLNTQLLERPSIIALVVALALIHQPSTDTSPGNESRALGA